MDFIITFLQVFLWGIYLLSPILIAIFFLIIILGLAVGRIESWSKFDSIYWALITALTVGYGDIRPCRKLSKLVSIFLGTLGIMLGGILVAITVEASTNAFNIHASPEQIQRIEQSLH